MWRLEFQLRREALRSLRIGARRGDASSGVAARRVDTWADALAEVRTVWRHLTTRWLSVRGQRTKNLRQVFAPEWQVLIDAGFADGTWPGSDDNLYRVAREDASSTTTAQLAGYLAAGLAEYQYLVDGDATLDDALPLLVQRARRHAAGRGKPVEVRARQRMREWSRTEHVVARRASRATPVATARDGSDAS